MKSHGTASCVWLLSLHIITSVLSIPLVHVHLNRCGVLPMNFIRYFQTQVMLMCNFQSKIQSGDIGLKNINF